MTRTLCLLLASGLTVLGLGAAAPAAADTLGAVCPDSQWMKLSTDAATGQRIVCAGAYPDPVSRWESTSSGRASNFNNLPMVGRAGSSCAGIPAFTLGQSSDGYVVWCLSNGTAYFPGMIPVKVSTDALWSLYSP